MPAATTPKPDPSVTLEALHAYCTSLAGVTESTPFGPDVLVLRAGGKIFALVGIADPPYFVNLKCDPERAMELRAEFEGVRPGYHMNKVHWNSVYLDEDVPNEIIRELIDHSYELVVASLSKTAREALGRP